VATVAASSASLLVAMRSASLRPWILYALSLTLGLYTFPNTGLVVLGHAVFICLSTRSRRVASKFLAAAAAAFFAYLPWIAVMVLERGALQAGTRWTNMSVPFHNLLRSWLVVSGLGVFDHAGGPSSLDVVDGIVLSTVVVVEIAALVVLRLRASRAAWIFVATLIAAPTVPLMLADLLLGGVRSEVPRFQAPAYLGLTIALAFLVSEGLAARSDSLRGIATIVTGAVIGAAAVSYAQSANAQVWWNQDDGAAAENLAVSQALNRVGRPLLISTGVGTLLEMSHYVRADIPIRVVLDAREPPLEGDLGGVLLYGSPANGVAARRLAALVRAMRRRHAALRPITLPLPCCGAGIRRIPDQVWELER
jgi:uncharacterized membrane protein